MNKKLLCVCALSLLLTGCGDIGTSNVASGETVTIDATEKLDPTIYIKDLDKDAKVDYEIKDNQMIITLTKGDKTKDITIPVEVNEPTVSVDRHITVDKYVGYDLEEYIHEDEGITHTTSFDEDTGKLSVTFTKGEWTKVIDDDVTVLDSNPINNWPKKYSCHTTAGYTLYSTRTFFEDGTWVYKDFSLETNGTYTFDDKNTFVFDYGDGEICEVNGNFEHFEEYIATTVAGEDNYDVCDLIKE